MRVCVVVFNLIKGRNDVCPLSSLWRLYAHLNGSTMSYLCTLVHKYYPVSIDPRANPMLYGISPLFLISYLFMKHNINYYTNYSVTL